ncbi:DNA polymerase III subunit gamma and tau [Streptacidiphilus sp. EB129]|uniref:DNA polymerase III subunit gamma and tau n=1 Tax=Streptacidiphilus sp. EB129 TaxID=3156262 RepID=UPI003510F43D
MSLALYRRYRPETYAEVIGQEHVTGPLQQALRNNRVNHAYLFSGPRGCGKTTSARILARCLNCEQGPTPTPCGECRSCLDLARGGGGSIDVIEIDAASHGGVDDTRDLREKAFFAPASSRYKIYIIDEAHMVSTAGFNALLKVVEEPPEHLKFIFATTEPEKVIGTIRSRTHHYPFRLVPPGTLRDYLAEVCGREDIQVEDSVYPLVVRAGAGSVRDSMSVMDQLLAGADDRGVTYAMATALLGYTDAALLDEVVNAFAAQDGATVFGLVDRVVEGGHDPRRFAADLLERLRDLVILSAVPDAGEKGIIDAPADRIAVMEQQARQFGAAELSRAADIVNTGLTEMRGATSPRLQLELICARVMLPGAYGDERSTQARLDKLERRSGAFGGGLGADLATAAANIAPGTAPVASHPPVMPATVAAQVPVAAPAVSQAPAAAPGPVVSHAPAAMVAPAAAPAAGAVAQPTAPPRGAWPVPRSFPGDSAEAAPAAVQAPAQSVARTSAPMPASAPASAPTAAPVHAGAPQAAQGGAAEVRRLWPQILEAVKNRRRFTWILLSQNGQVAGFDGSVLQISFINAGARDSFVSSNSDDILRQALADALGVDWRVECIVDPSGNGTPGQGPSGLAAGAPDQPYAAAQPYAAPAPAAQTAPASPGGPPPAPQQHAAPQPYPSQQPYTPAQTQTPPQQYAGPPQQTQEQPPQRQEQAPPPVPSAPEPQAPSAVASVPPMSPDDDIPEAEESAFAPGGVSGPELIMRELGATVIEEIEHDR